MSFFDDIKYKLTQNNAVVKLIALNVAVYLVLHLLIYYFGYFKPQIFWILFKNFLCYMLLQLILLPIRGV